MLSNAAPAAIVRLIGNIVIGFPLLYPAAIRPDVALSGEAGKHSSGVAFAGKNAIAPPDPAPDTIRRCGTFRQKIFPPVQSGVAFGTAGGPAGSRCRGNRQNSDKRRGGNECGSKGKSQW